MTMASPAFAGGSGMPWEDPLQQIADSITGPVAKIAGIIAVALAGLGFAFAEGGGFMKKILGIVFGLAIAFSASTFRSEEHTSELQSLMRISYAVFCLKKKKKPTNKEHKNYIHKHTYTKKYIT